MTEPRSSIRLSEFFDDDDSEGHLLAEFIKKRTGDVQKENFLFMSETKRLSLDVQLERLSKNQFKNNVANDHKMGCIISDMNVSNKLSQNESDKKLHSKSAKNNCNSKIFTSGRRSLLQEFRSTIEGNYFSPTTSSTPLSKAAQNTAPTLSNKPLAQSMSVGKSIEINTRSSSTNLSPKAIKLNTANKSITCQSCCGQNVTLNKDLQTKDAELKNLESVIDNTINKDSEIQSNIVNEKSANTNSNIANNKTLMHTYTVEKSSIPGQIILMPENITVDDNINNSNLQCSTNLRRYTRKSSAAIRKHNGRNANGADTRKISSINCPNCSISQGEFKTLQTNHSSKQGLQNIKKDNVKVPEDIAETNNRNKSVIMSSEEGSILVIPFNQNIININGEKTDNINNKSKQLVDSSPSQSKHFPQPEDIKLRDILTDDEEDAPNTTLQSQRNLSNIPLNLAPKLYNSQRKLNKNNYHQRSPEAPPIAHSKRIRPKRKCYTLNKAPGIPLNGENFARELSRMSNYEILDLRKRNSMDKIFIVSGRKSNHALEEIKKQKFHLGDQIERELLNRWPKHSINQLDQLNVEDTRFPVPKNFRDSLEAQEKSENISKQVCLFGEKSSDRIKLKKNTEIKSKAENRKSSVVLQQYFEVKQKFSRKDGNISKANISKETLYNSEEFGESFQPILQKKTISTSKDFGLPYLKTNKNLIETSKISSPSPISTTCEIENNSNSIQINEADNITLPPPPAGFENDVGNISNSEYSQYHTNVTVEVAEIITTHATNTNNNDDDKFKKPSKIAPRRRIKKGPTSSNLQEETAKDNGGSFNSNGLRRSKRGKVPPNFEEDNGGSFNSSTLRRWQQSQLPITRNARKTNNKDGDIFEKPSKPAPKRKVKIPEDNGGLFNSSSICISERCQVSITTNAVKTNSKDDLFQEPCKPAPKGKIKKVTTSNLQEETAEANGSSIGMSERGQVSITTNARTINNKDDDVFEKPSKPAPKRKVTTSSNPQEVSAENNGKLFHCSSIGISKHGQVPISTNAGKTNNKNDIFEEPYKPAPKRKIKKVPTSSNLQEETAEANASSIGILEPDQVPMTTNAVKTNNKDDIFQEPCKPAPKRKIKKVSTSNLQEETVEANGSSIGISEPGQVPITTNARTTNNKDDDMFEKPSKAASKRKVARSLNPQEASAIGISERGQVPISTNAGKTNNKNDIFEEPCKPAPKRKIKKVPTSSNLQEETAEENGSSIGILERDQVPITTNARTTNNKDDDIFEKPTKPAPKGKNKKLLTSLNLQADNSEAKGESFNNSTLRRSNRRQVPIKHDTMIDILHSGVMKKQKRSAEYRKKREAEKKKLNKTKINCPKIQSSSKLIFPENRAAVNIGLSHGTNTGEQSSTSTIVANTVINKSSVAKTISSVNNTSNSNSNNEFLSWLINMRETCDIRHMSLISEPVNGMVMSAASVMCFTELQGVEYAFYNVENGCVGYLRFKPRQVKSKKKTKRFNLQFINLMGKFRISIQNSEHILVVGDMVIIEKLVYYDIQNLTDDLGLLMVIKK